jgi:periplasmic protein TonB
MKTNINIYADEWCNMVFEGKNKEYGAFAIRTESSKQQVKALFIAILLAVSVAAFPLLSKKILPAVFSTHTEKVIFISIATPKTETPKVNIVLPKPLPRPMIRFTTPLITANPSPEDEMQTQQELNSSVAVIGFKNMDGDINSNDIPDEDLASLRQEIEDTDTPRPIADKMPHLPNLTDYLNENIHYPEIAMQMQITGKVIVQFVVGKKGEISNIKVLRGIGGGCDEEAVRVVREMPRWNPGIRNSKFVPVIFTLPITFQLTEQ